MARQTIPVLPGLPRAPTATRDHEPEFVDPNPLGLDLDALSEEIESPGNLEGVATEQPGAIFDARYWMLDENGRVVERPGAAEFREADARAGTYQFPINQRDDARAQLWRRKGAERKATKKGRLHARRQRMHARAIQQGNIIDQMRANQPTWMNVPRFPGESDEAYAARYAAFAQMMGQRMGGQGGGGNGPDYSMMAPLLQYILGQQTGQSNSDQRTLELIFSEIRTIDQQLAIYDQIARDEGEPGGISTDARAVDLRRRRDKMQDQYDRLLNATGGRFGGGGRSTGGIFGGRGGY
jgi:hypothetical protein